MNEIEYPKKRSEAEIQALLWYFLRKRKIDARLQVTAFNPNTGKKSCKLDLVVFSNKEAVCIVECKSWTESYAKTYPYRTNNSKQTKKYKALYELPILMCGRANFVSRTITSIEEIIEKYRA